MLPSTGQRLPALSLSRRTDSFLQLRPEVTDQTLDRPSEGLAERADGVALDLLRKLLQHINLPFASETTLKAVHDLIRPLRTLATGGTLAAGLVVVELGEAGDGADHVGGAIHDDDGGGAEPGLRVLERVEVHELLVARLLGQDGSRGTPRDDGFEVVPSATHPAAVLLDELAERDRHLFLDGAGVIDVAGDAEELGPGVAFAAERAEPGRTAAADCGGDGDGLDVGDGRRAAEEADGGRERRL